MKRLIAGVRGTGEATIQRRPRYRAGCRMIFVTSFDVAGPVPRGSGHKTTAP